MAVTSPANPSHRATAADHPTKVESPSSTAGAPVRTSTWNTKELDKV